MSHASAEPTRLREAIDQSIAAGDAAGAHALLRQLWRAEPDSGMAAAFATSRFDRIRGSLACVRARVASLRSFTVEPAVPLLRAGAAAAGIDLEVHVGEFNAYAQEILDPGSALHAFAPDVVILAVQSRDIAPELWSGLADLDPPAVDAAVARVLADYRGLLTALRQRLEAHVVLHDLELPARPAAGVLGSQAQAPLARVNAGLRALAAELHGVYVLDYDGLVARHGRLAWHDERKWLLMRMPFAAEQLPRLAREWLRFLHPLTGRVCKALVCDLDNTLWGGVVGEDGPDGLALGVEYPGAAFQALQRAILDLHRRGVLLAVCSKNNAEEALEVLREHPGMLLRPEHFAALRIDWNDKAQNLMEIARELNIGVDALAFIDDNPVERELVSTRLPEVTLIDLPEDPMGFADALRESPVFERLSLSEEDKSRGRMYAEQRERAELQRSAGSLEDFYHSLEMQARFAPVTPATLARAAQLTQKTNQFNLTTRRYNEQQVAEMLADPAWVLYTVSVRDRFGDNGIVGVMIVRAGETTWEIDTFLMSCRVIGRTVETAMLATLRELARAAGARRLSGWFIPTRKNAPALEFFPKHGFDCTGEQDGARAYELDLERCEIAAPRWIERTLAGKESPA